MKTEENRQFNMWMGECMRKKRLKESWANDIIKRAKGEGNKMYKYFCPHCQSWHVTKQAKYEGQQR